MKTRVLFICTHNSARSQMAEALLNHDFGDSFLARSAGYDPLTLNPLAVEAMCEIGIDIAEAKTKKIFDLYRAGEMFSHVITLCNEDEGEHSPIFPGSSRLIHWSFPNPAELDGPEEYKLERVRQLRDELRERIAQWVEEVHEGDVRGSPVLR